MDRFTDTDDNNNNNEPNLDNDQTETSERNTESERVTDLISRFTDYRNNPSTHSPSPSSDVAIQSHEDGEDDHFLDPTHRIVTGVIDNSRGLANSLIPTGLENTKQRVNSGLDRAQTALDTAIEISK